MALGEAGSLYLGAALPDLLSMDTPRDPVSKPCFPRLVCQEPSWLLYHAKYCFLLRGQMARSIEPEGRPICPFMYVR